MHERAVVKIDPGLPLDRAALLGCGVTTGLGAVFHTARVQVGTTVAVFGCGGIGLNAIQGARLSGATRIIAVDRIEAKLDLARRLGATHTVNAGTDLPEWPGSQGQFIPALNIMRTVSPRSGPAAGPLARRAATPRARQAPAGPGQRMSRVTLPGARGDSMWSIASLAPSSGKARSSTGVIWPRATAGSTERRTPAAIAR